MKRQAKSAFFVLFASMVCSSVGYAYGPWYQTGAYGVPVGYGYGYGGYGAYGVYDGVYSGFYGGGYGGVGSIYSGMGDLVRAEGERNVANSQAEINYQQANIEREKARSAFMDNAQKYRENRDKLRRETHARDAANREAERMAEARRQKFEAEHRPLPLSPRQLDPSTGKIEWPTALQSIDFQDLRSSLDSLFKTRAESGPSEDLSARAKGQINKLKDQLRSRIMQIPLPEVTESRKFLDRLAASVN